MNFKSPKIVIALSIIIIAVGSIIWLTLRQPARTTAELAQSYLDFILQGDEASANGLTQTDAVCSAPDPYMRNEIAQQTAVFAQTSIRNLSITIHPTDGANYPATAETADIRFEFQPVVKGPWQPAYLWLIILPNSQNENDKVICHLGGSSQFLIE